VAIEPDYAEMFSEVVSLIPPTSVNGYGERSYTASAAASVAAHLMAENTVIRQPDGREVVQTGKAYLYGTPTVDTTYQLLLADGDTPTILSVDVVHAEDGPHHTVLGFGKG